MSAGFRIGFPLLCAAVIVIALAGCSTSGTLGATLSADAKQACSQQAVFNTLAGAASFLGPQIAAGAAVASAAVGIGCRWANS